VRIDKCSPKGSDKKGRGGERESVRVGREGERNESGSLSSGSPELKAYEKCSKIGIRSNPLDLTYINIPIYITVSVLEVCVCVC